MTRGKKTDQEIEERILELYASKKYSASKILQVIVNEGVFHKKDIPHIRTISDIIAKSNKNKTRFDDELDQVWSIGLMSECDVFSNLPWQQYLDRFLIISNTIDRKKSEVFLTLRTAKWIIFLDVYFKSYYRSLENNWEHQKSIVGGGKQEPPEDYIFFEHLIFQIANFYSNRERWAKLKNVTFETRDLDSYIHFTPWFNNDTKKHYEKLVDAGLFDAVDWTKSISKQFSEISYKYVNIDYFNQRKTELIVQMMVEKAESIRDI